MDRAELQAPPKLSMRAYRRIVASFSGLFLTVAIIFALTGILSFRQLAMKAALIVLLAAAAVWLYSRLVRAAAAPRPERAANLQALAGIAVHGPLFLSIFVLLSGTPFSTAAQGLWMWLPVMTGSAIAVAGVARRVGDSLHCPNCEYEFGFSNPDDAPIRCPECGTGWLGRLKQGRRVRSVKLIAIGAIVFCGGVILFSPIFYMRALAPHLSTPLLYASVYLSPKGAGYAVWPELSTRTISAEWTRRFAEQVLERRAVDEWDTTGAQWFEAALKTGKLSPDLVERYYRQGLEMELLAPRRVRAGQPFEVRMRVPRASHGFAVQLGVMFGGYSLGEDVTGRQDKTLWAHDLRSGSMFRAGDVLKQELTVNHKGETDIRATYWLVYLPSFMETLQWQADGTPVRPATALWFERVDVDRVVRVE